MRAPSTVTTALLLAIASTVLFAIMHSLVRYVSGSLHPFEIAFFRSLFGFAAVLPLVVRAGPSVFKSKNPKLLVVRGVTSATSMLCWFYGLSIVPIADATALSFTNILFATLGVSLFLGEPMRIRRWSAVVIGFVGMMLILRPGFSSFEFGTLIVLISAVLWGVGTVLVKTIARTDGTLTIVVWAAVALTIATAIPAATVWIWPSPVDLMWLALIGTLASVGTLGWTYALKTAEATMIIPTDFTRLVWAAGIGYFFSRSCRIFGLGRAVP